MQCAKPVSWVVVYDKELVQVVAVVWSVGTHVEVLVWNVPVLMSSQARPIGWSPSPLSLGAPKETAAR